MWSAGKKDGKRKPARKRRWWLRRRRIAVWGSLALLLGAYGGYEYVTDPARLRALAERELGNLLGVQVSVGGAEASLNGSLLLRDVRVRSGTEPGGEILTAGRIDADLKLSRLLRGDVVMERLLIAQAKLTLCENEDAQAWNVEPVLQRLQHPEGQHPAGATPSAPPPAGGMNELPQVQIAEGEVIFSQVRGGKYSQRGSLTVNAGINSMGRRRYSFDILSHASAGVGEASPQPAAATTAPMAAVLGTVDLESGEVMAQMRELSFDPAIVRILPHNVRRLVEEHACRGAFRVPLLRYRPVPGRPPQFEVRVEFDRLGFLFYPRYWLSRLEQRRLAAVESSLELFRDMGLNRVPAHPAGDAGASFVPVHTVDYLADRLESRPIQLENIAGAITFTSDGIVVRRLAGSIEGNQLQMHGELHGYDPASGYQLDGPGEFHIATAEGQRLRIPPTPQFMTWMPDEVRSVYQQFQPAGWVKLEVDALRTVAGADVDLSVIADLEDCQFTYDDFPYPLYRCSGRLLFGREQPSGDEKVTIDRLRGHGEAGGANADGYVELNGKIGPFIHGGAGVDLYIVGKNVHSEPALRQAFPREVRKAFNIFGPLDYEQRQHTSGLARPPLTPAEVLEWPRFAGDFTVHASRLPGPGQDTAVDVDLDIQHAWGTLKTFPYPMEDLAVQLHLRDETNTLTIENAHMKRGDSSLRLDGTVKLGEVTVPELKVQTTRVPMDEMLLQALPRTEQAWLRTSGLAGEVDIGGRIFAVPTADGRDTETSFDLDLAVRNASLLPRDGKPAASALTGDLRLQPNRLEFRKLTGRREAADLDIKGTLTWGEGDVGLDLWLGARQLLFDHSLYDLLPADAKEAWDSMAPEGVADAVLHYAGTPKMQPATQPASAPASATASLAAGDPPKDLQVPAAGQAAPQPATRPSDQVRLEILPLQLTVTPRIFPYRIELSSGRMLYDNGELQLKELTGRRGDIKLRLGGEGEVSPALNLRLKISADNLLLEPAFMAAAPSAVSDVLKGMSAGGRVNLALDELSVRETNLQALSQSDRSRVLAARAKAAATRTAAASTSSSQTASKQPDSSDRAPLDVEFAGRVQFLDSVMTVGLPVTKCRGEMTLKGAVVADRLKDFSGGVQLESFIISGIPGDSFTATLEKPQIKDQVRVKDIRTNLAGGVLAGACTFEWYERSGSRYAVDLVLSNALMKYLVPSEKSFADARLTASLNAQGEMASQGYRQGSGQMEVAGHKMYQLPLMVGLSQVVTLGLPVTEPLNNVRLSYFIDNHKVTLENMEARSATNLITGKGTLDIKTGKIDMTLTTDSPQKLKIPGIEDFLRHMQRQLYEIRVGGTLGKPEVQPQGLPTFKATLDQVLRDKR